MPYKEKEIEKLYYAIGEVAAMLGVNPSLIRYWEKEFDILKPRKNAKGDRFFTKEDISHLQLIYQLVKEQGYTLEGAKARLKADTDGAMRNYKLIEKLRKIRGFLVELKDQL